MTLFACEATRLYVCSARWMLTEVVGYSRYNDQAAIDAHFKADYFQELGKQIEAEGLLAKPLNIMTVQPIGGFDSR
jgi:quinol monooxygenase YgiN